MHRRDDKIAIVKIRRLLRAGKRREAIKLLRQHVKQSPDDSNAWFYLGTALDGSGKMSQAIPCYLRALRLNPCHPRHYEMCLYLASSYRKTDRPQAARRWLKKAAAFGRKSSLEKRLKRLLLPTWAGFYETGIRVSERLTNST